MSDCCVDPKIDIVDNQYVCQNCWSLLPDLVFDEYINPKTSSSSRINKFTECVVRCNLPWYHKEALIELFPKIESEFGCSGRTNFVNMEQLIIEMSKKLGYPCNLKGLKTKARAKQVERFTRDAIYKYFGEGVNAPFQPLEQLELVEPKVDIYQDPRDIGTAIFSDLYHKK